MKSKAILFASVVIALPALVGATEAESPLGDWARGDGEARVRIEPCGADLCAINTWIKPGDADEKTGDRLILSMKPTDPGHWSGEAFDPQRNLRYNMTFVVGKTTMQSQGCVLGGILCKSMDWSRIDQE